jgi:hypothetical protein
MLGTVNIVSRRFYISGDRKYGVPPLDPLLIEKLSMTQSGITATSLNFTIVGLKDVIIEDFR